MKRLSTLVWLLGFFCIGCKTGDSEFEKFQSDRSNIVNVGNQITDIKTEAIFGNSMLYILDDFLIVEEVSPSMGKGIHLFNKNTFEYVTSTAIMGQGPGEIIRTGKIGVDSKNKILWVPDQGKRVMLKFPLDSVLNNEMYKPGEGLKFQDDLFVVRFGFLNDSIALGKGVHATSKSSFEMQMAEFNVKANETRRFGYEHPEAVEKKSNSYFGLSIENNIYVSCYIYCDLMTICDLEGNLKYNIYGPDGMENKDNRNAYFKEVGFVNNHIIASYIGDVGVVSNEFKRSEGNLPSKFLIFDKDGNYKKTIETGHKFTFFCVDEENKRVIAFFDDKETPLAYFNLNLD